MLRIKQAMRVLIGDVDVDELQSLLYAASSDCSTFSNLYNEERDRNQSLNNEIEFLEESKRDTDRLLNFILPDSKSWSRIALILYDCKMKKAEPWTDDELRSLMAEYGKPVPSVAALNQMISFLRTKKGMNIKRKNSRYTL